MRRSRRNTRKERQRVRDAESFKDGDGGRGAEGLTERTGKPLRTAVAGRLPLDPARQPVLKVHPPTHMQARPRRRAQTHQRVPKTPTQNWNTQLQR